jgi:hypothetical protein
MSAEIADAKYWTALSKIYDMGLGPAAQPKLTLLDEVAISAAVKTLGIERDVNVIPLLDDPWSLGFGGVTEYKHHQWIVSVALRLPPGNAQARHTAKDEMPGLNYVLWHELGHVISFERHAIELGTPLEALLDAAYSNPDRIRLFQPGVMSQPGSAEAYLNLPEELDADAVATKYMHSYQLHR